MREVNRIEKLQCSNCGGHLTKTGSSIYTCDYCGTTYKVEEPPDSGLQPYRISIIRPGCRVLEGRVAVAGYEMMYIGEAEMKRLIKDQLLKSFMDEINEHFDDIVELEHCHDFEHCDEIFRARMRVLDRFERGDTWRY